MLEILQMDGNLRFLMKIGSKLIFIFSIKEERFCTSLSAPLIFMCHNLFKKKNIP